VGAGRGGGGVDPACLHPPTQPYPPTKPPQIPPPRPPQKQDAVDRFLRDTQAKNPLLYKAYTELLDSEKKMEELAKTFEQQAGGKPQRRRRLMQAPAAAAATGTTGTSPVPGVEFDAAKQGLSQEALDSFDLFKDNPNTVIEEATGRGEPGGTHDFHRRHNIGRPSDDPDTAPDGRPLIEPIEPEHKAPRNADDGAPPAPVAYDEFGDALPEAAAGGGDDVTGDANPTEAGDLDPDGDLSKYGGWDEDEMLGKDTNWGWRDEMYGQVSGVFCWVVLVAFVVWGLRV